MKKISLESYEMMADDYAGHVDDKPWNADYERPATLGLVGGVEGMDILDAGCAAGWYSQRFLEMGARRIVGLDFSPQMIARCERRLEGYSKGAYDFYCHDLLEEMDLLGEGSFHKVVSSLTMHYLKEWDLTLREFHRVLKPGGDLIISTHHPFMEYLVFERKDYFKRELIRDVWEMNGREVVVEFYSRPLQEIINAITGNGFVIKEIAEPMPTPEFRRKDPENYEILTKRPQFLFIRAQKV